MRVGSRLVLLLAATFFGLLLSPAKLHAIPAFSRMYNTSCSTCHIDFPKLNDFGKAFKDAGFRFPQNDESFIKIPPVLLGAPAQIQLWPHTIWPGRIPGLPPIGLRMNNFFQMVGRNRGNFDTIAGAPTAVPPFIPRTDFETGLFSIFTAGNFGSGIAFWVDDDISVSGDNSAGGLGDGYLKFINLGRYLKLPTDALNLRVGQFELELPFSQARSWNVSPWDIYQQANAGVLNPAFPEQNVNNASTITDAAHGVEISGGHHYGGYYYAVSVSDQNTTGVAQSANTSAFVPSATGSNNGGLGFASDANFKDVYARIAYRRNLEHDPDSRHAVQAAGATGPRDHTYLQLGTFYTYGRALLRLTGATTGGLPVILSGREPFYRAGADFSFNYRTFNLFGLWMYGRDQDLLPVDAGGAIVLGVPGATAVGFIHGAPATFSGGFMEADYLALPWVMAIMRWDAVNSAADRLNSLALDTSLPASFFAPFHNTRNRFTPGVQFLIRANIKASFEYQIRPQQSVTVGTNPVNGLPIFVNPFRTNAATAALEWVY